MLKVFRGLVLTVAMIVANAYVSPTYAASADVVIAHMYAGGPGAALQELVTLYNNSPTEVDITDWCIKNKNNVTIICLAPETQTQKLYLPSNSYAVIASTAFIDPSVYQNITRTYIPTNQSSGSIVGSSDTLSLVNRAGVVIDSHGWTVALPGGTVLERKLDSDGLSFIDTDQSSDWQTLLLQGLPESGVVWRDEPNGQLEVARLIISELLPNAKGSDEGNEFIELYNPNEQDVELKGYMLNVGPGFETSFTFPDGSFIAAHSYVSFSNVDIHYSLLNTSSRVQLMSVGGFIVDETPLYEGPKEDFSWALFGELWYYTQHPTPGAINIASDDQTSVADEASLQPCAANQYRSVETNRCRLIAVSPTVTPCKDGQYRSEETNRCRNIATDATQPKPCDEDQERNPETGRCRAIAITTSPAPCKAGQERNPETNRCRTVTTMTQADYAVLGTQSQDAHYWYVWAAVGGIAMTVVGYAVWEWRWEFSRLWVKCLRFVRSRK